MAVQANNASINRIFFLSKMGMNDNNNKILESNCFSKELLCFYAVAWMFFVCKSTTMWHILRVICSQIRRLLNILQNLAFHKCQRQSWSPSGCHKHTSVFMLR